MSQPFKFRFPSEEAFDVLRTRFLLDSSPLVEAIVVVGTGRRPTGGTVTLESGATVPEFADTDGFLVDIMFSEALPDLPDELLPFAIEYPEHPRHSFGVPELEEATAAGAIPGVLDLSTVDINTIAPTAAEVDELKGDPGASRKLASRARRDARDAVGVARVALSRLRGQRQELTEVIARLSDAVDAQEARRVAAVAAIAAADALIDDPASTAAIRRDARETKQAAQDDRGAAVAAKQEAVAAKQEAAQRRDGVVAKLPDAQEALRTAQAALKALRS